MSTFVRCLTYLYLFIFIYIYLYLFIFIYIYLYLFIYIIYTEIPVQHSWFKWVSVQNNINK